MEHAIESRLRATAIVEAITLADDPIPESDPQRRQSFIELRQLLAHPTSLAVVPVVDWITVSVSQDDDFQRPIDDRHLRHFLEQYRRCLEPRSKPAMTGRDLLMLDEPRLC